MVAQGVYALCRHPGILWFTALYFCLWQAFGGKLLCLAFVLFSGLDFLYAVIQDRYIFPLQIEGYNRYKTETPFLIPTRQSFGRCLSTLSVPGRRFEKNGGHDDI